MSEEFRKPSSRFVFDRTIQIGTIISMATLLAAGLAGSFAVYQGLEARLNDQKMTDMLTTQKIESLIVDLRVLKESMAQLKVDQKETDNALRKTLDSIADDLLKVRISLAGRRGHSGFVFPDFTTRSSGPCGPAPSYPAPDTEIH